MGLAFVTNIVNMLFFAFCKRLWLTSHIGKAMKASVPVIFLSALYHWSRQECPSERLQPISWKDFWKVWQREMSLQYTSCLGYVLKKVIFFWSSQTLFGSIYVLPSWTLTIQNFFAKSDLVDSWTIMWLFAKVLLHFHHRWHWCQYPRAQVL